MKDLTSIAIECGVFPTLFAEEDGCAERVVRAIEQTEVPVVEILQRGHMAKQTLAEAVKLKKNAYVGAGTVCTLEHCKEMVALGADFIVSPGFNPAMVEWCVANNVPVIPGVQTTSEIMLCAGMGLTLLKAFPFRELGGTGFYESISGPFPDVRFVATGFMGHPDTALVASPKIAAVGGVWMFQGEDNHAVVPEEEIVSRLSASIALAKEYKKSL